MARNSELIRQWEILREVDGARTGIAIAKLAALRGVHQRTIRRDLEARCQAGFPLYTDKINGTTRWKLRARPFKGLEETGLGLMELCGLYFTRSLLDAMACTPFRDEVDRAFVKIERALPASVRGFLDALPGLVKAKMIGHKKIDAKKTRDVVGRAADAALHHRRVTMRYASASSRRTKDYVIEPLRLTCAAGGLYLTAWVPEYSEARNFAMERIQTLGVLDERFEPRPLPPEPFANSIGAFSGTPEDVEIEFDASAADHVKQREWHPSQEIVEREDGSIRVRLSVCIDWPLRTWVLGFGAAARVVSPPALVRDVVTQICKARRRYAAELQVERAQMIVMSRAS